MVRIVAIGLFVCLFASFSDRVSAKEGIVVDLARHDIPVSTGFDGAQVLLFGASAGEGDILVKVRGPEQDYDVTRKHRVSGIWVGGLQRRIVSAPAFYHILTSRAMEKAAVPDAIRRQNQLELRYLSLHIEGADADSAEFIAAFVRSQRRLGLYKESSVVDRMGHNLFRATLLLPPGLPTGTYTVETFLVKDGQISSAQVTPLFVRRSGGGALVFSFAERFGFLYGILAVVLALVSGLFAYFLFHRP